MVKLLSLLALLPAAASAARISNGSQQRLWSERSAAAASSNAGGKGKSGSSALVPTDATYYNAAQTPGADPFVTWDAASGYYYAYSTEGMDPGWFFAIYKSPDLVTWQKIPGGAIKACSDPPPTTQPAAAAATAANATADSKRDSEPTGLCWARDWQWAPEMYHNAETGWYFLLFAGRLTFDRTADWFRYSAFEEPSKIGIARSRSPEGPFEEIERHPIEYYPFDPNYHDVNLIMDEQQLQPPKTQEEGQTAPRGIYIPSIDPNIYFDDESGKIFLYFSRNAYRNWNWDQHGLNKYIEESNILGVELKRDWWDDPSASTMPQIADEQVNANLKDAPPVPANITSYNATGEVREPPRKDGWKTLISYNADPQSWENADVNDYAKSNGTMKDRRWSEGSTVVSRQLSNGTRVYVLTYSANNYEQSMYGIGYATGPTPLGPFKKSSANPVLHELADANPPAYSVGHGSIVATVPPAPGGGAAAWGAQDVTHRTPADSELFYVHHGRNSTTADRSLYTTRMTLDVEKGRDDALRMHLTTQDQPIPDGVAPYKLVVGGASSGAQQPATSAQCVQAGSDGSFTLHGAAYSMAGAQFDLQNGLNRLNATASPRNAARLAPASNGTIAGTLDRKGNRRARVQVTYQRKPLSGAWKSVSQGQPLKEIVAEVDVC